MALGRMAGRICLLGLAIATAAGPAVSAPVGLPLGPGRLEGTVHPYVVKRYDSLPWIAVRFGVHPVRLSREGRGSLSAGETLKVDQRRITPGFGALDGGQRGWITADLKPGDYVLICFIPGDDGVPHFSKGMLTSFTVK